MTSATAVVGCRHDWHPPGRMCWTLFYDPNLTVQGRACSLSRLGDLQPGDHAVVITNDSKLRSSVLAITSRHVVVLTLDGQVAVINVAEGRLNVV